MQSIQRITYSVVFTFPNKTILKLMNFIKVLLYMMLINLESNEMLKAENQEKGLNQNC